MLHPDVSREENKFRQYIRMAGEGNGFITIAYLNLPSVHRQPLGKSARYANLRRFTRKRCISASFSALHQDDVVLLLVIDGFYLQRDRLADEIAQHRQMLRLFFQEHVDY